MTAVRTLPRGHPALRTRASQRAATRLGLAALPAALLLPSPAAEAGAAVHATEAAPWVAFTSAADGLVLAHVTIDEREAVALIDTGLPGVVLDERTARGLGKPVVPVGPGDSVGGVQPFGAVDGVQVELGGERIVDGRVEVADLRGLERDGGVRFDLVVGAPVLARTGLTIDRDHNRLRLRPDASAFGQGTRIPLRIARQGAGLAVDGVALGAVLRPLLLDSGSDGALVLSAQAFAGVGSDAGPTTDMAVVGGGGIETQRILTLPRLRLGPLAVDDVPTRIEPEGGFLARQHLAGVIGSELLGRYNMILDPAKEVLLLAPRRTAFPAQPKSTVGVQGRYEADRIVVVHVMANSPAARAGLEQGDEICSIDGQRVANGWASSPMRRWGTRPPGEVFRIALCSGRIVRLVSADFY